MPKAKFGITYSERDDFSDLPDYARKAEALGFDSLWVTENITSNSPALECFVALSFMAAHTRKLIIGPSVILLPLRNPVLVARMATSLDLLSGGRMVLGVGVGGPGGLGSADSDYLAYGGRVRERGAMCEEALEVIKGLWTQDRVTFHGKHYRLDNYALLPRPVQRPHPPIWVGGGWAEAILRRTARWGDAFNPVRRTPEDVARVFDQVDAYAKEYGRKPGAIERTMHLQTCLAQNPDEAAGVACRVLTKRYQITVSYLGDGPFLFGPPERISELLQAYIDVGVRHFVFNMVCAPEEAIHQAETIAERVLPHLR